TSVSSTILTTVQPASNFSKCRLAVVSIRCGGDPALVSWDDSAMEKQAAWAAANSSSGFVPLPSPKRSSQEERLSNASSPKRTDPPTSFKVPPQTACALRIFIGNDLSIKRPDLAQACESTLPTARSSSSIVTGLNTNSLAPSRRASSTC